MENNGKQLVKREMLNVMTLNLLQNGGCPKNDERLVRERADTLPALYVFASRHQLSHPLTMFDRISPIYGSVCPPMLTRIMVQ